MLERITEWVGSWLGAGRIDGPALEACLGEAEAARRAGDPAAEEAALRKAVTLAPRRAGLHLRLGYAWLAQDRLPEAASAFRRAIRLDPGSAEAHGAFGLVLGRQGHSGLALDALRRAAHLAPTDPAAHWNLALALWRGAQPEAALAALARVQEAAPEGHLPAAELEADILLDLRRWPEAAAHSRLWLARAPHYGAYARSLGRALTELEVFDEAEAAWRQAVAIEPANPAGHEGLGLMLQRDQRLEEAVVCFAHAIELDPRNADRHVRLGIALDVLGRFDAARESYERALALAPGHAGALAASVAYRKVVETDRPLIAALERRVLDAGVSRPQQARLYFALGKAYDDLGEFDQAFSSIRMGNRLRYRALGYDPQRERAEVDALMARWSVLPDPPPHPGAPVDGPRPVFVVGMPRSGTTLVEQVIAAHPQGAGAGELLQIPRMARELNDTPGGEGAAALAAALQADWLPERTRAFRARLARDAGPHAQRIVDKMPWNFRHLGLIATLFPDAFIVHCERHPLDTCLSCYWQDFTAGNAATFDLEALAACYLDYLRLMRHWQVLLPGRIHTVRYESLVADPEPAIRALLAAIDLPWAEACLHPEAVQRSVQTASAAQVRQGIYTSSTARWRRYERGLKPLIEALGNTVGEYEAAR